jgi:hypothetical protein
MIHPKMALHLGCANSAQALPTFTQKTAVEAVEGLSKFLHLY